MTLFKHEALHRLAGVILIAAALVGSMSASRAGDLAGSEWRPVMIGGTTVPEDAEIFVRFEAEGALTGNGGCNAFFGSYKISGERLEIGPMGATQMECPEAIMDQESAFMGGLQAGKSFERDGTNLELFDDGRTAVMSLVQRDAD